MSRFTVFCSCCLFFSPTKNLFLQNNLFYLFWCVCFKIRNTQCDETLTQPSKWTSGLTAGSPRQLCDHHRKITLYISIYIIYRHPYPEQLTVRFICTTEKLSIRGLCESFFHLCANPSSSQHAVVFKYSAKLAFHCFASTTHSHLTAKHIKGKYSC